LFRWRCPWTWTHFVMTFCGESSSPLKEKTINIYSHVNEKCYHMFVRTINSRAYMYRSDCRWTDFFGYFGTDRSKQPLCWLTVELELRLVWNSRLNCPTSLFHRCPGGHVDHSNSRALVLSWKPLRRTGDSLVSGSFCVPWTQHPDSEVMVSCWSCGASWSRAFIVAMTAMRWDTSFVWTDEILLDRCSSCATWIYTAWDPSVVYWYSSQNLYAILVWSITASFH
jgi:hypothetical protein